MLKPLTLALLIASPAAAQRMEAQADCTGTDLQFDCTITLTQGGLPAEGVSFTVTPDMPGMPMAHTIAPAQALPTDQPGTYTVPLHLDMPGQWRLRLDITAPRRDLVILDTTFGPAGHGH